MSFVKYLIVTIGIISAVFLLKNLSDRKEPISKNDTQREQVLAIEIATTTPAAPEDMIEKPVSAKTTSPVKIITKSIIPEKIIMPISPPATETLPLAKPELEKSSVASTSVETQTTESKEAEIKLSPLDEASLLKSVVKIECPADGGKYIGSGFAVKGDVIITAAHVIADSVSETCTIIFSNKRRPIHYLKGVIVDLENTKKRLNEEGIDFALLKLPSLNSYPEARAIYGENYPYIPYPSCSDPKILGDKLLHFGYPSNYVDQNYLSELDGEAVLLADIKGIKDQLSQDQDYTFKTPILGFTYDEAEQHPYIVSRVASFYGDSGGLAFNATKQCILGPHRGGTIGKGAGENFSIFINVGWEGEQKIIAPQ